MNFAAFTEKDFQKINRHRDSLLEVARNRCRSEEELSIVKKAFEFANEAHKNVRRRSGEPYIIHPIEVAKIVVTEIGLGYKSIVTALLHDVVEDTEYTVEDIKSLFGEKVASLVDGLTKIKTVLDNEDKNKTSKFQEKSLQAENFKRILLTLNDDVRVVLIKLADRLHNCRTIEYMPEHKRDKILSETMYIFIPLAHRLGLYSIKSEMENIWLKYKEPEEYLSITERVNANVSEHSGQIDKFIVPIRKALEDEDYKFEIRKRIKTPYSIWKKMKTKNLEFDEIYDLYAVRIIFDPEFDDPIKERKKCYDIYATITSMYRYQQDRLRDWIKQPKSNGYEALHCTVMSQGGSWIEVQIRSRRMDDIAEKGIAAHWAYKQDGYISESDSEMDHWLAKVKEIIDSPDVNSLELLDIIHKDLVSSEIVVFTPKGEQRSIQNGSTVLDFAYDIHSYIGNHAIAAKVNMKLTGLKERVHAGDQIEIITAETASPQPDWLRFIQTRSARKKILDYVKSNCPSRLPEFEKIDDLTLPASDNKIIVKGDVRYVVCSCCNPIPGDPVVGFRLEDGSILVHKKTCRTAESYASKYGNRMVVPNWESDQPTGFPANILIKGIDRVGLLNEITRCISLMMGINMRKLNFLCDDSVFEGNIEILVRDRKNLEEMMDGIQKIEGIISVVRKDIQ